MCLPPRVNLKSRVWCEIKKSFIEYYQETELNRGEDRYIISGLRLQNAWNRLLIVSGKVKISNNSWMVRVWQQTLREQLLAMWSLVISFPIYCAPGGQFWFPAIMFERLQIREDGVLLIDVIAGMRKSNRKWLASTVDSMRRLYTVL